MKEFYKFENVLSGLLIDEMFQVRNINYNLRYFQGIANTKENYVKMGLETIPYCAPRLRNLYFNRH